jgi:hypothetical protein
MCIDLYSNVIIFLDTKVSYMYIFKSNTLYIICKIFIYSELFILLFKNTLIIN